MNAIRTIASVRVLAYDTDGGPLASETDALEVIGTALGAGASHVAIPVERFDPRFFDLATGLAGAFLQKLVNYGLRIAVVGDLSQHLCESKALRDFVRESNRGRTIWFVASDGDLESRLTSR